LRRSVPGRGPSEMTSASDRIRRTFRREIADKSRHMIQLGFPVPSPF